MHQSAIVLVRCVPGSSLLPPPYWKARRPWGRGWVYIRLCKHGKRFLLLKRIFTIFESLIIYSVCSQSLHKFLFSKALQEIFSPPNSLYRKGANSLLWGTQIIASSVSILSYFYRTKNFFSHREQIIII